MYSRTIFSLNSVTKKHEVIDQVCWLLLNSTTVGLTLVGLLVDPSFLQVMIMMLHLTSMVWCPSLFHQYYISDFYNVSLRVLHVDAVRHSTMVEVVESEDHYD